MLDDYLAAAIRSGAGALEFAGERKVSREEAERLAEEFQAEVIDKFYVREEEEEVAASRSKRRPGPRSPRGSPSPTPVDSSRRLPLQRSISPQSTRSTRRTAGRRGTAATQE